MAQHDYNIADQSGLSFLSDLNDNLSAIVTNNSGVTEPSSTYAYMWWADTTSGILKQRNTANTAWISKSPLTSGGDAAYISNTPAGNLSATNVQTALNELQSNIDSLVYASVASMVADTTLLVGMKVRTLGYYLTGDGGGNDYEIVAAATGTADGGSYIDLATHQSKGLFVDSTVNVKQFGAKGDGVSDDTAAIQSALDFGGLTFLPEGTYSITSMITIPEGGRLSGVNGQNGTLVDGTNTPIYIAGSRISVAFGSGLAFNDWNNSAISMSSGTKIDNLSFYYPNQNLNTVTPTSYPPAISAIAGVRGVTITDINLGAAYVGIDATRDHNNVYIDRVVGFPLYRGIRFGSMVDNSYISNVHFNGMRILTGDPWVSPNVAGWVADNGNAIEVNRASWSVLNSVFAYGYAVGVSMVQQVLDVVSGINNAGSVETIHISDCGFDSCHVGISCTGDVWGVHINNTFFAPRQPYNLAKTGSHAVYFQSTSTGDKDITITGCRVWSASYGAFTIINAEKVVISDNTIMDYSLQGSSNAVYFDQVINSHIKGNIIDGNSRTGTTGIIANTACSNILINANTLIDIIVDPIRLVSGADHVVTNNNFKNCTKLGVRDDSLPYTGIIKDNQDPNRIANYVDGDVTSNVLQIRRGDDYIKYIGTLAINGIKRGLRGQVITVRFSNVLIVTDEHATPPAEEKLHLAGSMTAAAGHTLTLLCDAAGGWVELSRSAN